MTESMGGLTSRLNKEGENKDRLSCEGDVMKKEKRKSLCSRV